MPVETYIRYAKEAIGVSPANKIIYSSFFDAFVILAVFFVIAKLVVAISTKVILRLTKKTKTVIDDLIVSKTNKPVSAILFLIGVRLAFFSLDIGPGILDILEKIIGSLIIIVVTYIVIVVVEIFVDNWLRGLASKTESKFDDQLVPLLHRFSRIFIGIIGILFILSSWGIQIGPLLASLGIVGIAVAFALQSTLGNIFGGMTIIIDKSVKVGDKIRLDNETMGTVMDVGLRSTKIKTWDGELITIPNGKLADSKILNFMQPEPTVRIVIEFGVEYGSDTSKVRKIVLDTVSKITGVLKEPAPKVMMMEMADFALKFRALFWVGNFDIKYDTKALATEEIYNALRRERVGIPFPTRTIYMRNEK